MNLANTITNAVSRRAALLADPAISAVRLFHGAADGLDGWVVERFGPVLIAQAHDGRLQTSLEALKSPMEALRQSLSARAVYLKHFPRDRTKLPPDVEATHRSPTPWLGEAFEPEIEIAEHGLRYRVRPYAGYSVGLFLEHRNNRKRVRELSAGKRVLNLFCYTCGFSVAAAAGGAAGVSSVDLSPGYLDWGRINFAANELDSAGHLFFKSDVFEFYKRAARQGRRYDLIVLDPPSFSKAKRPQRTFVLDDSLEKLVDGAKGLLAPGGTMLLSVNHRSIPRSRLERAICEGIGPTCKNIQRLSLPPDFPEDADYSKMLLAQFE